MVVIETVSCIPALCDCMGGEEGCNGHAQDVVCEVRVASVI